MNKIISEKLKELRKRKFLINNFFLGLCEVCKVNYTGSHKCRKCKVGTHPWHGVPVEGEEGFGREVDCFKCLEKLKPGGNKQLVHF